jgi:hypothetical protein
MSSMQSHDLQCPQCGNTQEVMVWDSINVTLDPELKETLFAGEVNLFVCEKCGKKAFISAPLLYHDMTLEFCVQYYPPETQQNENLLRQFRPNGSLAMTGVPAILNEPDAYLARPHLVFDMREMLRYVMFRDALAAFYKKETSEIAVHTNDHECITRNEEQE